jgi:hypothetical protein
MITALLQTVCNRIQADAVAVQAVLNALLHLLIDLIQCQLLYSHCDNLYNSWVDFKGVIAYASTLKKWLCDLILLMG